MTQSVEDQKQSTVVLRVSLIGFLRPYFAVSILWEAIGCDYLAHTRSLREELFPSLLLSPLCYEREAVGWKALQVCYCNICSSKNQHGT